MFVSFTEPSGNVRPLLDWNSWRKPATMRRYSACSKAVPTGTRTRPTLTGSCRIWTPCTSGLGLRSPRNDRCFRACSYTDYNSMSVIFLRRSCTEVNRRARDVSLGCHKLGLPLIRVDAVLTNNGPRMNLGVPVL